MIKNRLVECAHYSLLLGFDWQLLGLHASMSRRGYETSTPLIT
jgi:hypothetical protein